LRRVLTHLARGPTNAHDKWLKVHLVLSGPRQDWVGTSEVEENSSDEFGFSKDARDAAPICVSMQMYYADSS